MFDLFGAAPVAKPLSEREKLDRLRLIRTEQVGPVAFRRLLERFGSAELAIEALPDMARRGGRAKPLRVTSAAEAEREMEANERIGARLLFLGELDYPARLAAVEDAPPVVSVIGHAHLLKSDAIAIVGARNASLNGRRIAQTLAADLGKAGLIVVSGLARGIDAAAHEGALATGTVAVLAGGVDVVYPEENRDLYARIAEAGAIVAESPVGSQPQARHFPRRNRIVSGLSLGVIAAEAALRSGSLITMRQALEQGREVFAVPGSPLDPRCQGANDLIRQGAALTENAEDVLRVLDLIRRQPVAETPGGFGSALPADLDQRQVDAARDALLEAMSPAPTGVDDLIRDLGLAPAIVLTALLELELAGRIERHPGNRVSLA